MKASLGPQSLTILNELYVCGADAKTETDDRLNQEFLRVFAQENPEDLQWAFREHRKGSRFFPAIADIENLLVVRKRERREKAQMEEWKIRQQEIEKGREAGLLVKSDEIAQTLAKLKQMPSVPAFAKHKEHLAREASIATPSLQLSPDEIAARRDKEREEILRYGA